MLFLLLEHAKPARIIGLGNVSLFADYGDLGAASTVEPVLRGTVLSDQFLKVPKITSLDVL